MPTIFTIGAASARGFGLFGVTAVLPAPGLWSWGYNNFGGLGLGNTTARSSPNQVGTLATWSKISAAQSVSLAIKTDGTLWSWGRGIFGSLGLGNTTNYSSPKQVGALTTWSKINTNQFVTLAIKTDGTLWSWGQNNTGQLGLGNVTLYSSPKQIGALTTWATVSPGSFYSSFAIKTDGTLWAWGYNGLSGALGLNTSGYGLQQSSPSQVGALTTWVTIAAGNKFSLAIKTDGTLWSWGLNSSGELGLGNTTNYSSPKQVGALTTWSKAVASSGFSGAIKTDGTLWSWGTNASGQLGLGNITSYSSPKQVGALTTWATLSGSTGGATMMATTTANALWAWGQNTNGGLGLGNTTSYSSPKQVGALTKWTTVSAGQLFALAIQIP